VVWYNTRMKDLEKMGDALEDIEMMKVLEAMADHAELGDADIEAWFTMWTEKENA